MSRQEEIVSIAERVIDADPTLVWSLVADPERIGEWSGFELVGYMGTELPSAGHSVFVVPRRSLFRGEPRRVEIKAWNPGAGIKCVAHTEPAPTGLELTIHPEVESNAISTRVRLVQRSHVPVAASGLARRWAERRLSTTLDRISRAART